MTEAAPYVVDPDDPRAPSQERWDAMTISEREAVIASLPNDVPRRNAETQRANAEAQRADAETQRANAEAERVQNLEQRLAEALAEIERLRRGG